MPFRFKTSMQWSAIAIIGLAAACGDNKVVQCNQLIDAANTAVNEIQEITASGDPSDPEALNAIANTADSAVATMQGLELSDEELQTYQQRFVQMYERTGTASRELYNAATSEDNEAAQQALDNLQAATQEETRLVSEVNAYCGGTSE
jgi:hypothetical protein